MRAAQGVSACGVACDVADLYDGGLIRHCLRCRHYSRMHQSSLCFHVNRRSRGGVAYAHFGD